MTFLTKLMISAGVLSHVSAHAETDADKKIKELRRQTAVTRQVRRGTTEIKRNVLAIRKKMLLSGVIDQSMIKVVDKVLMDAQMAGDEALKEALRNLVLAVDDSARKNEYIKRASAKQQEAIGSFDKMLKEARQNADQAQIEAAMSDLIKDMEALSQETKEAAGKELSDAEKEALAEKQTQITDKAKELEDTIKALDGLSDTEAPTEAHPETPDKDSAKTPEETAKEKKKISEESRKIVEKLEDGNIDDVIKKQKALLDKLKKDKAELTGEEPQSPEPQNSEQENEEAELDELMQAIEQQISDINELEASGREVSELGDDESFENMLANHQDIVELAAAQEKNIKAVLNEAQAALDEFELEIAR